MKNTLALTALVAIYLTLAAFAVWLGIHFALYIQSR